LRIGGVVPPGRWWKTEQSALCTLHSALCTLHSLCRPASAASSWKSAMRETTFPLMATGPFVLLSKWWHSPRIRYRILLWTGALVLFTASLLAGAWFRVCAGGACPSISQLVSYDPDQA